MADKFQLKALITGVDKLSPMLKGIQQKAGSFRKQLEKSGLGKMDFGSIAAGGALAAPIVVGVKAAMDFESKMADVKKVVDFDTPEQFQQMGKDVLGLARELPMAAGGIAQIVAAGGQAGIPRAELKGFASDAVKMGVAFDQTADEAGQMMATWRTAFKMGQGDVTKLADQVNYLGNTGPASAKKISNVVTSIGPLGAVAGMASGQIAAMGATLIGMGTAEEVAATGMKNFMLSLTAGASATKSQQETFKALRLDAKQVAVSMQKDAQGTIMRVLNAVSKVDKSKQAAVLSNLFGKESIGAIAPLLTNLDLLESNFKKVGDATLYSGSMNKEYAARAATTANNLQLLVNKATEVGIAVGTVLLPPFNDFMDVIGPVVTGVGDLAAANPWLIKGLLGAGLGFVALKLAVMGTIGAMKLFAIVSNISPLGFAIRAIALLAGFMIGNWSKVAPWFQDLWRRLVIVGKFAWEMFKGIFSWTPLGMVIKNWEPIVEWFGRMWDRIKPFLQPILDGAGKVVEVAGRFFASSDQPTPQQQAASETARRTGWVANDRSLEGTRHSIVTQSAQAQKAQMSGRIEVDFKNAPEGMQVSQAKTDQPGLEMTPFVGYRSLGRRRVVE
ncbi:MAG: phage tail tape measure protein [Comamonas sp.]